MKALVVIPTYNEAENVKSIVEGVLRQGAALEVLIVDDGSPDGTGAIVDEMAGADPRISVIHRPGKLGLGTAYVTAFRQALRQDFDAIMEMDADGSHDPASIPGLLAALSECDAVVGSRYMAGGGFTDWSILRQAISKGGNLLARLALGLPIMDATSGFRAYKRAVLEAIDLDGVRLEGYAFQVGMVKEAVRCGFTVCERPITFAARRLGKSKMSGGIVVEAARYVARSWWLEHRKRKAKSADAGRKAAVL